MRASAGVRYRFGAFELDVDTYELRRHGEPVPVEPQVFDVVVHLIAHRDRVVRKEELLDEVWGDRFVSESALTTRLKSAREARALFLVAGPSAGATPEVRAALRKLMRALPEPLRARAEAASSAMVVDPAGWDRVGSGRPPPPFLDAVRRAVIDGEQLSLDYVARDGSSTTRVVHPLGVAAKGANWYLVAGTDAGLRTFRVDRIESVAPTGQAVVRPDGFDLEEAWKLVVDKVERMRTPLAVQALVDPEIVGVLPMVFGTRLGIGGADGDGRVEVEVRGHSIQSLVAELAGFGSYAEVVEPRELRGALAEVGRELIELYG